MPARKRSTIPGPAPADDATPRYRSGAVARMLRMPVATLRIWESRYRVASPATTASGHRLYSAADVRRLALLKQLTEVGHAIGGLAALSMPQLHDVATTHASALAGARPGRARAPRRLVVVGTALAARLRRPALVRRLDRSLDVVATFASLADAVAARSGETVEVLLVHAPILRDEALGELEAVAASWGAPRRGVLYGFATTPTCDAFDRAGIALLREPQDDPGLSAWLHSLGPSRAPSASPSRTLPGDPLWPPLGVAAPRRYDDATLADFAGLSSTIACECPRQVAELLTQLTRFEAYSAECASRSPADAALHGDLQRVAGAARALFETALERVAIAEGLVLRS
jgi:DNA-binding transcriptional MerR regulator